MEKKFYKTKEFKSLSKQWEQKLKKDGLEDIEKNLGESRALKQNASNAYRQMEPERREVKERYFWKLGSCLHEASFDSDVDCIVMTLKAEGAKIVEICAALKAIGQSKYRRTIRLIIRKYEDRWGIRKWTPNQLRYRWRKPPTR